jgi:hypothetical protein
MNFTKPRVVAAAVIVGAAVSVGLVLNGQTSTSVINACASPNGGLRIIATGDTCKNTETPLSWNVQGPPGPQGPQGVPGPPAPSVLGAEIVDATGAVVAPLAGVMWPSSGTLGNLVRWALIEEENGRAWPFLAFRDRLEGTIDPVFFKDANCTGQAYGLNILQQTELLGFSYGSWSEKIIRIPRGPAEANVHFSSERNSGRCDPTNFTAAVAQTLVPIADLSGFVPHSR